MTAHDVVRHGQFDPAALAVGIAGSGLLGEYVVYERQGTWHIGADPVGAVSVGPERVGSTIGGDFDEPWSGTPWPQVEAALRRAPRGWRAYGWGCFELAAPEHADAGELLARVMIPGLELELTEQRVTVRAGTAARLAEIGDLLVEHAPVAGLAPVPVERTDGAYLDAVERAVAQIRGGQFQKVILSRRVPIPHEVDMAATYLAGRRANDPARSFLLDLGGWQAAGFSPETVLEVDDSGNASTQPLAGTRARHGLDPVDRALRAELLADPKEVFEHAISVQLAFQELAAIGAPGSTGISEFLAVQNRGSVQHLGSRVATRLAEATAWDALAAVFPAVTASGIPKAAVYQPIRTLEAGPRGLYSGTVLMADSTGMLDAALVLRAVYQRGGRAWLRAGAGVVAGSTPAREHEETREKLGSVAPYVVAARPRPRPAPGDATRAGHIA
ncbi:salicylate synthase [Nocardia harenae]|uniref:salicylate synthase n=1 Tax=Nocardia harenae TaxID=358707 RepID=UPI000837087A|nr:salicylate synthase [Nocardia harenae]